MKELSIQEKAKAYDEAIEKARKVYNNISPENSSVKKILEKAFPELKENEDENTDEKVRKALIKLVTNHASIDLFIEYDIHLDEALSWLEKQGEHANFRSKIQVGDKVTRNEDGMLVNLSQLDRVAKKHNITGIGSKNAQGKLGEMIKNLKPADKVEPKFKVGDWILIDNPCQIESIDNNGNYVVQYCDTEETHILSRNFCDSHFRLWTIQDAKDGDVLANGTIVLIVDHLGTFESRPIIYSWYFADSKKFYGMGTSEPDRWEVKGFTPATKEQRDTLFTKMKESGYEWDSEKKELKKIEQKPAWSKAFL